MRLLHTTIPYAVSAQAALVDYPATNLITPEVAKPWRSSSGGFGEWTQAQRSGSSDMHLAVQGVGVDITGGNVTAGASSPSGSIGNIAGSIHADGTGRRKATIAVPAPNTYTRVAWFKNGTYYEVAALYLFATELQLPDALLRSEITTEYPQASVKLPNGTEFPVDRGPPRTRITLRWRRPRADDIEEVARIARAGICWLDLQNPDQPGWQWPVRCVSATLPRQLTHARQDEATLEFVEVV